MVGAVMVGAVLGVKGLSFSLTVFSYPDPVLGADEVHLDLCCRLAPLRSAHHRKEPSLDHTMALDLISFGAVYSGHLFCCLCHLGLHQHQDCPPLLAVLLQRL